MTAGTAPFTIAPGSIIAVRDEEWLVTAVEPTSGGHFVHAAGLSELVRDTEAVFSTVLDDVEEVDPTAVTVVADPSDGFRRARLWLEAMLRKTPVAVAEPRLTVARHALAEPLDYQLTAVRQALSPDKLRPRILLADAVGLGKTIEIGMILSELVRRGRGDRILIVTPKHVLEQMQMELWTRFALPFVRLDSAGIQRIRQILPANRNPFTYYKRVIISIDTLKSDRYVAHLRKQRWDAVVIDESHNVTNTSAQNNRLARLLASRTDALILASATPHNGRAESFAELIRLLDPSAVSPSGELDERQVKTLVVRRHRHHKEVAGEVGDNWAERQPPDNRLIPATSAEDAIARELEDVWLWPASGATPYSGKNASLFPWTLAKAFLSSPAALRESIHQRIRRLPDTGAAATERAALEHLDSLVGAVPSNDSAKYRALLAYLAEIGVDRTGTRRVVIFAERVATLNALADALASDLRMSRGQGLAPGQITVLHGGLGDQEQQAIVESFKLESSPIRILITGDVASEGVNLHAQCHHLVHYDIPWSLIRIEQRNGRIDRYGQRERPQIATLLLTPSTERFAGDVRVLAKLVEREHEAHRALGDTASLIGTYDVAAEEEAIREVLAGTATLEEVVRTVEEVTASAGLEGLIARLTVASVSQTPPEPAGDGADTGVYDDELGFLSDALVEFQQTPHLPPPNGVSWTVDDRYAIASLRPPSDLRRRLEVLPQDYLRARRVTELYKLAYSPQVGLAELVKARSGDSTSTWPEAHFLAPLHPLIDWAADRALAELGRRQVFAVLGAVDAPTVLVQVTQTNTRGQVVGTAYVTVEFPTPALPLARLHASAKDAVDHLGLSAINPGRDIDGAALQPLVAAAVRAADGAAHPQAAAIRDETTRRIDEWLDRSQQWKAAAGELIQRSELQERTLRITEEQELARAMNPDRRLVRPLLLVLPADTIGEGPA